jgi:[acyl-carrier-protein] S-malonyltransferase
MAHQKLVFLFPGQGAQYPGMGQDFFETFSEAREVFEMANDALGMNFSKIMFHSDAHTLSQTQNAQPALYIHSLAILKVIEKNFPHLRPFVTAGLSLGEYSALSAAYRMPLQDGLMLVKKRGELMQKSAENHRGTMAAVLPATQEVVQEVLSPYQAMGYKVWIANLNAPGQVVIAGQKEAIDHVTPALKEKGAKRVIFLDVSGAFHTPFMEMAQHELKPYIESTPFKMTDTAVIMNVTGKEPADVKEMKQNLINQVVSIVYWQKSIDRITQMEVTHMIEIGAGKTLTNMNKKMHTVPSIGIEKVSELEQLGRI